MKNKRRTGEAKEDTFVSKIYFILILVTALLVIQKANAVYYGDCTTCHNATPTPPANFTNVSAMNHTNSSHRQLNYLAANVSFISDNITKACWACHWGNGTDPNIIHPNYTNFPNPHLCYDCHSNNTGGLDRSVYPWVGNYSAPGVFAHSPTVVYDSFSAGRQRTNINTSAYCWECHNQSKIYSGDSNGTLISNVSHYGTLQYLPVNQTRDCAYCHKNESRIKEWYFNSSTYGYFEWYNDSYRADIRHPAKYNKTSDASVFGSEGSRSIFTSPVNASACRFCHFYNLSILNGSSFHSAELKLIDSVHYRYDWEGDDSWERPGVGGEPFPNTEYCLYPCHNNEMDVSIMTPKTCEDCHTVNVSTGVPNGPYNGTGGFELRDDYNESIPLVFNHFNGSQAKIRTKNMSALGSSSLTASTCFSWNNETGNGTCHGVSWENRTGKYFAFGRDITKAADGSEEGYRAAPYIYNTPIDYLPVTSNCTFCHIDVGKQDDDLVRRQQWGYPTLINSSNASTPMYQANLTNCYECHTTDNATPKFFHEPELDTSQCELCHFNYKVMNNKFGKPEAWINESMFNTSVHGKSDVFPDIIYCTDCHTVTSNGTNLHPGGNPSVFTPPEYGWKWCEACHVVQPTFANRTPNKANTQRHNITNKPQLLQYNVSGIIKNTTNITANSIDQTEGCIVCHDATAYNNAQNIFNRSQSPPRDCRFCHTLPDLDPESIYT